MGTVWTMVLMMPLIMMMATSSNRSQAWLELTVKIPTTTFTNSWKTHLSKNIRKVHLLKSDTSFQLFPATFSQRDSSHAPCPNERPWFSINSPRYRWSMAARTIPRNEMTTKNACHILGRNVVFLLRCMCSFELIRYEVWIWNIYCIHEGYLGLGVSSIRSTTKVTRIKPIFCSTPLPECLNWAPPEVTLLRPFGLTTSEWTPDILKAM